MSEETLNDLRVKLARTEERLDDQPSYDTPAALVIRRDIEDLVDRIRERERKLEIVVAPHNQTVLPFCYKVSRPRDWYGIP